MSKTELGVIVAIIKEGRPQYQVRLELGGQIVIVEAAQVSPPRVTLLAKGARLRVTHDLGRVVSASTDLALALNGVVTDVVRTPQGTAYRLDMEQGSPLLVARPQVGLHPEHELAPGAVLAVELENGQLKRARLAAERFAGTVLNVDAARSVVRVRGLHGDSYSVRLPSAALGRLSVGDVLNMEITYTPEGERKIVLEQPAPPRVQRSEAPAPKPHTRSGRQRLAVPPQPAPAASAGEMVGIDPLYLEQRRKESHRFEIMSFLEDHCNDGLIEWYRLKKGKPAEYASPQQPLPLALEQAIRASVGNYQGLFTHQAQALDAIRAGRNLVMVTPTASGKTLGYNPAIFECLSAHPEAHALYIFPLNALMTDQKEKLDTLSAALQSQGGNPVGAGLLVGGMTTERRTAMAQAAPPILATNPEMLSVILNEAGKWRTFFGGLRFVVVDEVHSYRGIFGLHMAGLLRRLLLTARRFGANPQALLSSATVSNPLDLAARLTSLLADSFTLLEEDGSAQAAKHWTVLNPDWGSASARYDNYLSVAAAVFVELLTRRDARGRPAPLNTLLFCRSIRDVNRAFKQVRELLQRQRPDLANKVKAYVSAALSAQEKREIYDGLRSSALVGVVSTNALEAGIDIGKLDAGIIAGFPFSVMAMRQMAGRIGRQSEGLVCFVPHPLDSLGQYYRESPERLLDQPPEVFVVDPENPYIARKHINAAAFALGGLPAADLEAAWGARGVEIARQAAADGAMRFNGTRWLGTRRSFSDAGDAYAVHNIRSNAQRPYAVCLDDGLACNFGEKCLNPARKDCPRQVTLLDQEYIYRDCHPGAIYEATTGKLYRVTRFDDARRAARVVELPDSTLERTYAEEDTSIAIGKVRRRQALAPGIDLAWGEVTVTRLFTGYFQYTLIPSRRCRRCHREYDGDTVVCPNCRRPTEVFFAHSRPERKDFPGEHKLGFQITLKTDACWLTVRPEIEEKLQPASPCKLPGEQNKVLQWLKKPLKLEALPRRLNLSEEEQKLVADYHARAAKAISERPAAEHETLLFPGLYGQCLLHALRSADACASEGRALEIFQAVTGYPVTEDLRHVCRQCQTSSLFPALHTLEHTVINHYPSVALGDRSDLGAYTTLGHAETGLPGVFWFDDYEGGLGAAEKIFDLFGRLVAMGAETIRNCACATLEGCPRCTFLGGSSSGNDELSKAAGLTLAALIGGQDLRQYLRAFFYRKRRQAEFDQAYEKNEYVQRAHGLGEEAPQGPAAAEPFELLRVQPQVHRPVLEKAFEVRSQEIGEEVPPLSALDLNRAFNAIQPGALSGDWQFTHAMTPYQVLEVLPGASSRLVQQVYRVIALQVHPDRNPQRTAWANEMMKLLNDAYEWIVKEKSG